MPGVLAAVGVVSVRMVVVQSPALMVTAYRGPAGQHLLELRVGARPLVGGATAEVWHPLGLDGTFSLAAVQSGLHVMLEAVLWRRSRAG